MLGTCDLIAFIPTRDPRRAREFYEGCVGLRFVSADLFAVVFDAHGVMVRVVDVSTIDAYTPAPFTILGWSVPDAARAVHELAARGVPVERFPGMEQDAAGIWSSPSGAKIAWFKDPDGNLLSVTEV